MTVNNRIKRLREIMKETAVDVYVAPTCDFHGSEYIGDYFKTREFITGFTGSAGTAVITMEEACLWTDGRYFLQAENQLKNTEVKLMKSGEAGVYTVYEYIKNIAKTNITVAFDGKMMSADMAENIRNIENVTVDGHLALIDKIWEDRPEISHKPIWKLDDKYTGKNTATKINKIRNMMEERRADVLLLSALDEVAWTLNLRGNDIMYTPVFMGFLIITKDEINFYVNKIQLQDNIEEYLKECDIKIRDYGIVYADLKKIRKKRIWLDKSSANYAVIESINNDNKIINKLTPALQLKAVKNEAEIENEKKAHILDGVAMTNFLYWLKTNVGKEYMDELKLGDRLEDFRKRAESYIEPSFAPIVGYNEHGAIVHYSATKGSNVVIKNEGIVLIDSGGHYLEGTTDITRTISLGNVTEKMKKMYTAVLKGHLKLSGAIFKKGCSGTTLDYIARKPLWDMGLDYNHGTGHGVGYLLSVHEAPNAIRYRIMKNPELNPVFEPGMITSNEPGVYLDNEFGIRIENLILCKEKEKTDFGEFLCFENLTYVPYDMELIDMDMLDGKEKEILREYNQMVYEKLSKHLQENVKKWLKKYLNC